MSKPSPAKEIAIIAVADGKTAPELVEMRLCSSATAKRWLADPEFMAAVENQKALNEQQAREEIEHQRDEGRETARTFMDVPLDAAEALVTLSRKESTDLFFGYSVELPATIKRLCSDDPKAREKMLATQALVLERMASKFITSAARELKRGGSPDRLAVYAQIGIKASDTMRKTIAVLSDLKNPKRTTFVKQQHVQHQQNIETQQNLTVQESSISEKFPEQSANEQLTVGENGTALDNRGTAKTGGSDSLLATVDAEHWPHDT